MLNDCSNKSRAIPRSWKQAVGWLKTCFNKIRGPESIVWPIASTLLAALAITGAGCIWPPQTAVESEDSNTEPRIVRDRTSPKYEALLSIPQDEGQGDPLDVTLCVREPDPDDTVYVRIFVDYPFEGTAQKSEYPLRSTSATLSDPTLWCETVPINGLCPNPGTAHGDTKKVDLVISNGFDSPLVPPANRASLTGHTDEMSILVTCE